MIEAAVAESEVEVPDKLVHARAHELLEDTWGMLARQGISKESYLRITGRDEEALAHEAEPEAAAQLRREAVLAAIVDAEGIEPTDEQVRAAIEPTAERQGTTVDKLFEQLRDSGRLDRLRREVATRQAVELLVAEAKPISVEQAKAREKLWTPGREAHRARVRPALDPGQLTARLTAGAGRTYDPPFPARPGRLLQSAGFRPRKRKKRGR